MSRCVKAVGETISRHAGDQRSRKRCRDGLVVANEAHITIAVEANRFSTTWFA
jgi:hypothetical protein